MVKDFLLQDFKSIALATKKAIYKSGNTVGPKLNASSALCRKAHEMLLNAFSKSISTIIPGIFLIRVYSMVSKIVLMFSLMYLSFR